MAMPAPRVYTVEEVADILKVKPRTVYNLVKDGTIRAVRIGERQMRITDDALNSYLRGGQPEGD